MDPLRLPVSDQIVSFQFAPDNLVLMARYLTAAIGKDRRRNRFIRNPRSYGHRIVERRLDELANGGGEAFEVMADQMMVWLRCAERDAPLGEPLVEAMVDFMIWGRAGSVEAPPAQAKDMNRACRVVLGHVPEPKPNDCEICAAASDRRWGEVILLTETPPELLRELYRNFAAVGYATLPPEDSF